MSYSKGTGYFWVRLPIMHYGVLITNRDMHKPPFSVREGYKKEWTFKWKGVKYGVQLLLGV
jgi:hypothetical protein